MNTGKPDFLVRRCSLSLFLVQPQNDEAQWWGGGTELSLAVEGRYLVGLVEGLRDAGHEVRVDIGLGQQLAEFGYAVEARS